MKLSYGQDYRRKFVSANQAVKLIKSGDWIDYGSMNGQVVSLDRALAARKDELKDIKVWNLLNSYPARILEVDPDGEVFTWNSWHLSARDRQLMKSGRPSYFLITKVLFNTLMRLIWKCLIYRGIK
jgi:acyl-CoA hydrolase